MGGTETRTRLFVDTVCDDDEGHDEVWAVPVDVEEGGGTYRLVTSASTCRSCRTTSSA